MALPAAIALSGLNQDYFSDGLNDVFDHGAVLLKSPSMSSVASASSQESGISSMSSESNVVKNLAPYFELLFKTQLEIKDAEPQVTEIKYQNRDILDLAGNIQWKWGFQAAVIRSGPSYFFENRSQVSRVLGAHIPEHLIITCSVEGCFYDELRYE